jgi:hypothetical protein
MSDRASRSLVICHHLRDLVKGSTSRLSSLSVYIKHCPLYGRSVSTQLPPGMRLVMVYPNAATVHQDAGDDTHPLPRPYLSARKSTMCSALDESCLNLRAHRSPILEYRRIELPPAQRKPSTSKYLISESGSCHFSVFNLGITKSVNARSRSGVEVRIARDAAERPIRKSKLLREYPRLKWGCLQGFLVPQREDNKPTTDSGQWKTI